MKKLLLKLGSISAAAIPVASVISCGVELPTKEMTENYLLMKSQKVMNNLELAWQEQVILNLNVDGSGATAFDKDNALNSPFIKSVFMDFLHRNIKKDKTYLQKMATQIIVNEEFEPTLTTDAKKTKLKEWGMFQYRNNGDVKWVNGSAIGATVNGIAEEAAKFIFKNIKGIKESIYKKVIAAKYVLDANMADYKARMMEPGQRLNDIQTLIENDNFVLVDQMIKQHLFVKWDIKLDGTTDLFKWINNDAKVDSITEIINHFKSNTSVTPTTYQGLGQDANYQTKHQLITEEDIYGDAADIQKMIGYSGIEKMVAGHGKLEFSLYELKKATSMAWWNGSVFTKDGVTDLVDSISSINELFSADKKSLSLNYSKGLMPIFSSNEFKFDTSLNNYKNKIIFELISRTSLYDDAIKFYTSKDAGNTNRDKFLLDIKSPKLRDEAIKHGFEFIKK